MVKYSVVIPIYNMEKYLEECVYSVVAQRRKDVELILVNDGSTDNSLNICYNFEKKFENIIIINKDNSGTTDTLVKGIEKANGKYICFIDADDKIVDNFFEIIDKYIDKDCDIFLYDFFRMFKKHKQRTKVNKIPYGELTDIRLKQLQKFYFTNFDNYSLYRWDKVIKTEILIKSINEIKAKTTYFEDHVISLLNLLNAKKIYYIDEALYSYRMRKNSVSHSINEKVFDDLVIIENEMKRIALKNNYNEEQLYKLELYFLYQYARNSLKNAGKHSIKKVKIKDVIAIDSKNKKMVLLLYKFRLKKFYSILLKIKRRNEKASLEEYFD